MSIIKLFLISFIFIKIGLINPTNFDGNQRREDNKWVLQKESQGIKASYFITACRGSDEIFLKLSNTNIYDVKVSWDDEVVLNDKKIHKNTNPNKKYIYVKAKSTVEATCNKLQYPQLIVNVNQPPKQTSANVTYKDALKRPEVQIKEVLSYRFKNITIVKEKSPIK